MSASNCASLVIGLHHKKLGDGAVNIVGVVRRCLLIGGLNDAIQRPRGGG